MKPIADRCLQIRNSKMVCGLSLLSCMVLTTMRLEAQESRPWSQFRGPNGVGYLQKCSVPLPWKDSDVKWKVNLPGVGNASPVIWGKTAYLFSGDAARKQRHMQALDLSTGKEVWRKSFALTDHKMHSKNNYACASPCVDQSGVYISYADPEQVVLVALTHSGVVRWEKQLGSFVSQHGFGASPVVHDGTVVLWVSQDAEQLPAGQAPGDSRILAFDAQTGSQKWSTSRIATRTCYGTPTYYQADGVPALLFANTSEGVFALDLATGKPMWNRQVFTQRSVSCPVVIGDTVIATEGAGNGNNFLHAVNLKGEHEKLFSLNRNIPYVPTPVVKDDLVFLWSDKGIVSCLKMQGNEILWSERVGGNVSSSPVIAGDKLIGIAEDGTVTVLSASSSFKNIGTVSLGEAIRSTPAVAEKFMLIRTDSKLLCIGDPS